jgi:hypothetical protein
MDFSQEIELPSVSLIAVVNVTYVWQASNKNAGKSLSMVTLFSLMVMDGMDVMHPISLFVRERFVCISLITYQTAVLHLSIVLSQQL